MSDTANEQTAEPERIGPGRQRCDRCEGGGVVGFGGALPCPQCSGRGELAEGEQPTTPDEMPAALRRDMLGLVAVDGIDGMPFEYGDESTVSVVLRAICTELAALSIKFEDETQPALQVLGAMVGGLFGAGTTSEDETMVGLYSAGVRLRERIGS